MLYSTLRDTKTGKLVDARLPVDLATRPYSAWDKEHFAHAKSEDLDPVVVRKELGRETFEEAWGAAEADAAVRLKAELVKQGYTDAQIKTIISTPTIEAVR